jgi:NADH:ubiquinone oxidoreductase subunit F (NADH-binding)
MLAPGLPRLLSGPERTESFAEHRARLGPRPQMVGRKAAEFIPILDESGLKGRGGAAFPTGRKWRAVAKHADRDAVVVANGSEGEPASQKDRVLMRFRPHLILDGIDIACETLDAQRACIVVPRPFDAEFAALSAALEERRAAGDSPCPVQIIRTPHRYVAGEATAVVNAINGLDAKPGFTPPRTSQRGVDDKPTLVQNVETLAHIALIARFGPRWFNEMGTPDNPGTAIASILGAVRRPGPVEISMGATLDDVVAAAGGFAGYPDAALMGGYFGTWLRLDELSRVTIDPGGLRQVGASFGCGVMAFLPEDGCGLSETVAVIRFLARESAQQCGPCTRGLPAVADALGELSNGKARPDAAEYVNQLAEIIKKRGACHHPDGAMMLLQSALRVFADDVNAHLAQRPCDGSLVRRMLPTPLFEDIWI